MSDPLSKKHRAALASIFASAFITLAKLVAGLLSGSLALISEAGHAALDTGATSLTYFAVRAADKPADEDHPFGHHKIESVAALIETGLLFVLAVAENFEEQRIAARAAHVFRRTGVLTRKARRQRQIDARPVRWRRLDDDTVSPAVAHVVAIFQFAAIAEFPGDGCHRDAALIAVV